MTNYQTPLFYKEIVALLKSENCQKLVDATYGEGGHGLNLVKDLGLKVLGIEWDPEMYTPACAKIKEENLQDKIKLINDNFANLEQILKKEQFTSPEAIIFDLGLSMRQIALDDRGFSFAKENTLDLRLNQKIGQSASDWLNSASENDIQENLFKLLEDVDADQLIQEILKYRRQKKITNTADLKKIIETLSIERKEKLFRKLLQSLRIIVNNELLNLESGLKAAVSVISNKGLIIVLTFHSLEDRIVKLFFKKQKNLLSVHKKALAQREYRFAQCAKLRIYQKNGK